MREPDNLAAAGRDAILAAGRNCWRKASAGRLAFLIDAAAYFRAFKAAALKARHSILVVGWDVDSRTLLEIPGEQRLEGPNELGPFLDVLARRRKDLSIRVLTWDSPLAYDTQREWLQRLRFDWFGQPNLWFAFDDRHPFGASQHQKIVVIDDSVAFLGGLDLTTGRLDSPEHRPSDPRRVNPDGSGYGPFHDLQLAVDGEAARLLGAVARERWLRATGQALAPLAVETDAWPDDLAADARDLEVGIARSSPAWNGCEEVREIERLFLEVLAGAEQSIFIENQYFSATRIAEAICESLRRPLGPEILLVIPQDPVGWLEQASMGLRQRCLLAQVREADRFGRFRVFLPVVGEQGEVPVKVHSKMMVVDGRIALVGSANLNNRSMGFDSECNLAIEAQPGSAPARAVAALRDRLLAEHLDCDAATVARQVAERGSLIAAVEALRGPGRSLVPFPESDPDAIDRLVAESEIFDPRKPAMPERIADALVSDRPGQAALRGAIARLVVVLAALVGLAVAWRWGPLAELADPANFEQWAQRLRGDVTASLVMIGAFALGGVTMFPVLVLIAAAGLLFGPLSGLLVAGAGSLLGATLGYGAGVALGRKTLRRLAGGRLDRISRQLARRGLLAVTVVRLLPVAPFTLVNLAAGASHIGFRDFLLGTLLGMAPGTVAITLFSGQLGAVMRIPDATNIGILAALLLVILAVAFWSWCHFRHRLPDADRAR